MHDSQARPGGAPETLRVPAAQAQSTMCRSLLFRGCQTADRLLRSKLRPMLRYSRWLVITLVLAGASVAWLKAQRAVSVTVVGGQTVVDSVGKPVGYPASDAYSPPAISLKISGWVVSLNAFPKRLSSPARLYFENTGCTGTPYIADTISAGLRYTVPIIGPRMTVFLPTGKAAEVVPVASYTSTEEPCVNQQPPFHTLAQQAAPVADLLNEFTPPFKLETSSQPF